MTPMRNGGVTAAYSHAVATIRRYRPEDLEPCRALWTDLTVWHRQLYANDSIGGVNPGSAFDDHLAQVGPERIFVAEQDGRLVGLAGMIVSGRRVELEPLTVRAGCRGLGIGRELTEAVVAAARAEGAEQVVVRPTGRNADAIRVFHALGFDVVSRVELVQDLTGGERWRDGEDYADRRFRV
jgi:N-acetylglutamate synthase-like GNAT family acetyltransferase